MRGAIKFASLHEAIRFANREGFKWVAIDKPGEVWGYKYKPVLNKDHGMWSCRKDDLHAEKLGWIEPFEDWQKMRWRTNGKGRI